MSKVDAMQAMREARYAARLAPKPTAARPAPVVRKKATTTDIAAAQPEETVSEPVVAEEEAICGHRSMNNRVCKRPAGHAEKNHRYN